MDIPEEKSFIRNSLIGIGLAFLMLVPISLSILMAILHIKIPAFDRIFFFLVKITGWISITGIIWIIIQTVRGVRIFFFNNHHSRGFSLIFALDILLSILICWAVYSNSDKLYQKSYKIMQDTFQETKE